VRCGWFRFTMTPAPRVGLLPFFVFRFYEEVDWRRAVSFWIMPFPFPLDVFFFLYGGTRKFGEASRRAAKPSHVGQDPSPKTPPPIPHLLEGQDELIRSLTPLRCVFEDLI